MKKYIIPAILLFLFTMVFLFGEARAITSYDVTNEVQMYLQTTITTTTATGIVLASPRRNGVDHTFAATTGGVLRLRIGSKIEDIHYALAEVRSDNTVNLQGVTRNLCTNVPRAYVTCGAGEQFSRGALVELNVDSRILNLKANIDRSNTFTANDAITFSLNGSLGRPHFATEALRTLYLPSPDEGDNSCLGSTGECYDYMGGAWRAHSGSNIANATESVAGKIELATLAEQGAQTETGSTAANMCIQAKNTLKKPSTYSGAYITCGSGATAVLATWTAITNGSFSTILDGISIDVTGLDFSSDTSMSEVAATMQVGVRAVTTNDEIVGWVGDGSSTGFTLVSVSTLYTSSASYLSAQGAGTDLSGAGATSFMDCDSASANTIAITDKFLDHSADENKVLVMGSGGFLPVEIGGTGSGSYLSGALLLGNTTGSFLIVDHGVSGQTLTSNGSGSSPTFQTTPSTIILRSVSYADSTTLTNPTSATAYDSGQYTIPADTIVAGKGFEFEAGGQTTYGESSTFHLVIMLGSTVVMDLELPATTGTAVDWYLKGHIIGTTTAGAASSVRASALGRNEKAGIEDSLIKATNVATNAEQIMKVGAYFGTTNGGNTTIMASSFIKEFSVTPF